jgi:hypothetical protein
MPVYVQKMTTEVAAFEGELPLSPAQIETLVKLVAQRLEQQKREADRLREATEIRGGAMSNN